MFMRLDHTGIAWAHMGADGREVADPLGNQCQLRFAGAWLWR